MLSVCRLILCQFRRPTAVVAPLVVIVLTFPPRQTLAAVLAEDDASDPTYGPDVDGAWKGLDPTLDENPPGIDDGGFGFLPWDFSGGYHQPQFSPYGRLNHFIDGVDFPASSFNQLGSPAFGLTNANLAFGGNTARATRIFESPLTIGDILTISFDNPLLAPLDPFSSAGFLFRLNHGGGPDLPDDSSVTERFGLFVTSGFNSGNWSTNDAAGFVDSGVDDSATSAGAQFKFTLTGADTYSLELSRLSDNQTLFSQSGTLLANSAGPIDSLEIVIFGNGSGNGLNGAAAQITGEREFFFDDLRIESASDQLLGDYNLNGVVDAADYSMWRDTLGQTMPAGSGADGDSSAVIDSPDYDIWKAQFGSTGVSMIAADYLPEPGTAIMAVAAFVLRCSGGRARGTRFRSMK